jgi:HAD superfamily hydrolase (TIGR01509 family)
MEAAIFDLDGTLLDSMGVWSRIDAEFLAKRGISLPADYPAAIAGLTTFEEAAEYTIARFRLADTIPALLREWNEMAAYAYAHTVALKGGAKKYLETLKAGGVKTAIATASPPVLYRGALRNLGMERYFDAICSTAEAGEGKNTPAIFHLAARKLDAAAEHCVVFEDSLAAVQSAKAAGMKVIAVLDPASKDAWDRIRRIADRTIRDFTDPALQDL